MKAQHSPPRPSVSIAHLSSPHFSSRRQRSPHPSHLRHQIRYRQIAPQPLHSPRSHERATALRSSLHQETIPPSAQTLFGSNASDPSSHPPQITPYISFTDE